ncbi:hypothetical protein ACH5RR_023203 [Cinchona calisaya]|uniref:Retrovirus-related Pol polyprotein from transposon TNT 1-94-like beta-barrel domain-containing protein n=1 Tax=Cinchona calisaya TaxID=153742 RepID=A0ABD2Z9Z8_9GENT
MAMGSKYPYPAALSVGNFVSIKLSQTNFPLWKTQILGLIESQDMFGFLDGGIPMPPMSPSIAENDGDPTKLNPDYILWRRSDRLLRDWIVGTLTEEVLGLVVGLDTSALVWKALIDSFGQSSQEREFYLLQNLQIHAKGTRSMSKYIRIFKSICDDLAAIGKPVDDKAKVFGLLKGLGPEYESFVTSMLKPLIPSYRDLIPLLQGHDTMKSLYTQSTFNSPNQEVAFVGQRNHGNPNYNKKGNQNAFGFNSKGRGFPNFGQTFGKEKSATSSNNANSSVENNSTQNEPVRCQICDKPRHVAKNCWHRYNQAYQSQQANQALVAFNPKELQSNTWFPDTGAWAHMTNDSGKLTSLVPYNGPDKICVGNDELLDISHIGSTTLDVGQKQLSLSNVLVVPNIKHNLLSVSQLTSDQPYKFEFSYDGFLIKDRNTKAMIARNKRQGGLYALQPVQAFAMFSTWYGINNLGTLT